MEEVKQVIVVRRDLNMRKGKMCAQVAHASAGFLRETCFELRGSYLTWDTEYLCLDIDSTEEQWFTSDYRKVVLHVRTEEELLALAERSRQAGLTTYLQYDGGATEFKGVKTLTCLAIGPDYAKKIDPITGKLPLL